MSLFSRLAACRRGNVAIITAIALPVLVAVIGLAAEYGSALEYKIESQRIADAAAFAAATAYSTDNSASISSVAKSVGTMNGTSAANVAAALVTSPTGSGRQAVRVIVTAQAPLHLTRAIMPERTHLAVSATSYAEIAGGTSGCVIALKSTGTGVTLSGGTSLSAPSCAVQSNNTVSVPCGTTMTTIEVDYNSTGAPSQPCGGITAPAGKTLKLKKIATVDPLAGDTAVAALAARLTTVAAMTAPSAPAAVAGTSIDLAYQTATTISQFAGSGCTPSYASNIWTVTCAGNGPFNFGALTVGGGITVRWNLSGSASAVYNFTSVDIRDAQFGPGTYNIRQGLSTNGGSAVSFGAGTFSIGKLSGKCNGVDGYSICHQGSTLTFGGPSTFVTQGGIYTGGGATITLGSGATNSFRIGAANDGLSFKGAGGAWASFADATGPSSLFQMTGSVESSGGGCTRISAATQHDIKGYFDVAGGLQLGSGVYTMNGYLAAANGGDVTCWGAPLGVNGAAVTLVFAAASTSSSGPCASQVFCLGAGYGHVTLSAPTTGTNAKLAVIGPLSVSNTSGAKFSAGASGTTISGAFYIPNGPINLGGGAGLGSGAGQCLQLIGTQISLSGGAVAATACISSPSASGTVAIVG